MNITSWKFVLTSTGLAQHDFTKLQKQTKIYSGIFSEIWPSDQGWMKCISKNKHQTVHSLWIMQGWNYNLWIYNWVKECFFDYIIYATVQIGAIWESPICRENNYDHIWVIFPLTN